MESPMILRCLVLVFVATAPLVRGDGVVIRNEHENKPVEVSKGKYRVPNPFKLEALDGQKAKEEFYYFKSTETSFDKMRRPRKLLVEEYFSLGLGLSYSLHRNIEHSSQEWAIIGDSRKSRYYVVRNPHADNPDEIDCELDHAHNHRHVFPWQFLYELAPSEETVNKNEESQEDKSSKKKKTKKTKKQQQKAKKAFVYGVGAIWLNAITLDARSDQVGDNSSYADSNSWFVLGRNKLKVELLFEKLESRERSLLMLDSKGYQDELDHTKLNTIRVDRSALVDNPIAEAGSQSNPFELIVMSDFRHGLRLADEAELARFDVALELCRKRTKSHRLFPSLLRSLSTSPGQSYELDYIAERFPLYRMAGGAPAAGNFDERKHRYTFPMEFVTEVFSLAHEAQTKIYSPMPFGEQGEPNGGRYDIFLDRFTEQANEVRSSRHSTAHYHLIEFETDPEGTFTECHLNERELLPEEPLFVRSLTFKRQTLAYNATAEFHGHLTGLGALLMNAADFHYKSFSLSGRTIRIAQDAHNLDQFRDVRVDEWSLEDQRHGLAIKFFIEQREREREKLTLDLTDRARADLARLVQIEVRTIKWEDDLDEMASNDHSIDDPNLLMRFTIVRLEFDADQEEIEFYTTPPRICKEAGQRNETSTNEEQDDSEADSHFDDPDFWNTDRYFNNYSSDDDDEETRDGQEEDERISNEQLDFEQQQGEEFELEQVGMMHEDMELPNFLDFLDGGHAYELLTRIVLEPAEEEEDEEEPASSARNTAPKHVWLREIVNLRHEFTTLKLYNSNEAMESDRDAKIYYIFYESELIFKVEAKSCVRVDELDELWMRLFSAQLSYYTVPSLEGKRLDLELVKSEAIVESNRLSLYGLGALWRRASESQFSLFLGRRPSTLEIDGRKFRELIWNYEEHEMDIHFHFFEDLSALLEDKKADKHQPGHKYLKLQSVVFENRFVDDRYQVNTFGKIRAEVRSQTIGLAGAQHFDPKQEVPAQCNKHYWEASFERQQLFEDMKSPRFEELSAGKADSYQMTYCIEHEVHASPSAEKAESSAKVVESFDKRLNLGKMIITKQDQKLFLFIDGNNKRIYGFTDSEQYGQKCLAMGSMAPIFSEALHLNLGGNPGFEPQKLYGLANLVNEFARLQGRLHVFHLATLYGQMEEIHEYKFHIGQGAGTNGHEPQAVELRFLNLRSRLQVDGSSNEMVDGKRTRANKNLKLSTICVNSTKIYNDFKARNKFKAPFYSSRIIVVDVQPGARVDWDLPAACKSLDSYVEPDASNGPAPSADPQKPEEAKRPEALPGQFPDLEGLLGRVNLFHMKSEVSIQGALEKVYLLEEWSHNGHLRMRSRGLGKAARRDFDFILYADSQEHFELSQPFACKRNQFPEAPLELEAGKLGESNLLQVWTNGSALINHLANSFYSPLTLWRMAQKLTARKKLLNEFQISTVPKLGEEPEVGDPFRELFERDLDREIWQVSSADSTGNKWSYEMEFVRKSRRLPDGRLDTWHVLQSISLHDFEPIASSQDDIYNEHSRRRFSVFIELANYKYSAPRDEIVELFRLPEGWGCQRAASSVHWLDSYDELRFDERNNWLLNYEASLELISGQGQDPGFWAADFAEAEAELEREMLPTTSGSFLQSGSEFLKLQPEMDLSTHHSQVRFANGRALARRVVLDRSKSIEYEIDKSNGFCTIALVRQPGWRLEFPHSTNATGSASSKSQVVELLAGQLQQSLFRELFLKALDGGADVAQRSPFKALNQFKENGTVYHTSYERELDSLKLTEELVGPARIVRRFSNAQFRSHSETKFEGRTLRIKWHDALATRVFLFDSTKTKLRALLDIRLERGPEPTLSQLLASAQLRQCFNDGTPHWDEPVASFTLDYSTYSILERHTLNFSSQFVRDQFYSRLINSTGLLPLQLDGAARIGVAQHENLFRIHFNVMEAPTSYIYFKESAHCAMEEELGLKSESRLAATLLDCSLWCDQTNCAAMSYCSDRLCRVVTARAIFGKAVESPDSPNNPLGQMLSVAEQLQRLSTCKADDACTYYFQSRLQARPTLARFKQFMGRLVGEQRDQAQLKAWSISLGLSTVQPFAFNEELQQYRLGLDHASELGAGFTGTQLDQTITSLPHEGNKQHMHQEAQFGVVARNKKLDDEWLEEAFPGHEQDGPILIASHAASLGDCYRNCCRFSCFMLSFCNQANECLLATAQKSFLDIRPVQQKLPDAQGCSVHARDHLAKFQKFEASTAPKLFERQLEDVSLLVCASMCEAAHEQCLSFDFCTSGAGKNSGELKTTCLLQKTHVSLDSFDRSVLLPEWEQRASNSSADSSKKLDCDHYSKNLLADFRRLANRKLTGGKQGVLRDIGEERCATTCLEDEQCSVFEFCRTDRGRYCYLARNQEDLLKALAEGENSGDLSEKEARQTGGKITTSKSCSLYVALKRAQANRLEHTFMLAAWQISVTIEPGSFWSRFLSALVYLFGAITLGALVQFAYIKTTSRPLLFDQEAFLAGSGR